MAGGEVDPIAVEAYRLLRERFALLARFAGPLFAGSYRRGDMKGTFYVTQLRQWLCVPETAGELQPDDAILSDDAVAASTDLFDVARNLILAARLAFDLYLEHLERIKSRPAFVADLGVHLTDEVALVVDAIALRGRGRSETYGEEQENA
jgi:hypothetical protein